MSINLYEEIIRILEKSESPVRGKDLAKKLNVTDRTIRNYIKKINTREKLIRSSENGYYLLPRKSYDVNKPNTIYDFSSQDERVIFIIKKIVTSNNWLNLYDLADEMYISYSTIEKDLIKVRENIKKHKLSIKRTKGKIMLEGTESNKRNLIKDTISSSNKISMDDLLSPLCDEVNVNMNKVKTIIVDTLKKYSIYANDYSLVNIFIHIIITIYRLKQDFPIQSCPFNDFTDFDVEKKCCMEIIEQISKEYNIIFNDNEKNQLTFLLISKTSSVDISKLTLENASSFIEKKYLDFTTELIKKINHYYYIDIEDNDFLLLFSLHLKNLIFRIRNNYYNINPISEDIILSNPLIYEISVFISEEIKSRFGCTLNKDEISFIVFHVGAIINRKKQLSQIIKAGLIYPSYYNCANTVLFQLNNSFSSDMEILNVYSIFENVPTDKYDLIINANPLGVLKEDIKIVNISPFVSNTDIKLIKKKIREIKINKRTATLKEHFGSFFDERLFERNHYFNSPEDMIRYMAQRFVDFRLADSSFVESVISRERMSATSFDNNVAIPHSIKVSTAKNCTYVIINDTPMHWGMYDVQIVILIGINENHRESFKKLYSSLLEALNNNEVIHKLSTCSSYTDFISILTSEIKY